MPVIAPWNGAGGAVTPGQGWGAAAPIPQGPPIQGNGFPPAGVPPGAAFGSAGAAPGGIAPNCGTGLFSGGGLFGSSGDAAGTSARVGWAPAYVGGNSPVNNMPQGICGPGTETKCACDVDREPVVAYVGNGRGEYIQETAYKFVGCGAGDFDVMGDQKPSGGSYGYIAVGLLLLVVAGVGAYFGFYGMPGKTTTVVVQAALPEPPAVEYQCDGGVGGFESEVAKKWCCDHQGIGCEAAVPGRASCLIWGDPHTDGFDHGHADFFGEGEAWIVRSESIKIQARYRATELTKGMATAQALAISGSFIDNHVLKVEAMNGEITWDGDAILDKFPGAFDAEGFGSVLYNNEGQLVDTAMNHLDRHIVHVDLPNLHIQIMRWSHHINVRITMPPVEGGQDGHCGNFNGDPFDDTAPKILDRIGKGVSKDDLIFKTYVEPDENKLLTLDACHEDVRASAKETCVKARPDIGSRELNACIFDVCFGGDDYAKQDTVY